jgi:hypothetical protein
MAHPLTTEELLFLQDMCLDGEFRCHQRAADAQIRGDYQTAAYEMQVKEQYSNLKRKLFNALHDRGDRGLLENVERLRAGMRETGVLPPDDSNRGSKSAVA